MAIAIKSCKVTDEHQSVLFDRCGVGTTIYKCVDCGTEIIEYDDTVHGG